MSSGELNRGTVYKSLEKITPEGMKSAHLRLIPSGTFVMAITGLEAAGTRGNCAILGFETTFNQSCMALIPNKKKLDSLFLFHWYRMIGEEYGLTFTQGTKQQSYNVEILKKLTITLPQVDEQKRIGAMFQDFDNLITLHQREPFLNIQIISPDSERITISTSLFSSSWMICKYVFCVVVILECPNLRATLAIDTPANNNSEA